MLHKQPINANYAKLFEPGYIGKLWIKNRIVKAPTASRLATMDGEVTETLLSFYRDVARGGTGRPQTLISLTGRRRKGI